MTFKAGEVFQKKTRQIIFLANVGGLYQTNPNKNSPKCEKG